MYLSSMTINGFTILEKLNYIEYLNMLQITIIFYNYKPEL